MADDTAYIEQYNGGSLVATAVTMLILTWLSVALRTYVRAFMTNGFEIDDWIMLVAQSNFTVSCSFILVGVAHGLGRHNSALPQWERIVATKWQALATATYITNMMFIKLSIGVFLLRLAPQRRYTWIIWGSMAVVVVWSAALFFWDVFQCRPVAAQWDTTIPGFVCVTASAVVSAAYALSVLNILTDWLYALLPIPMIWQARMTAQAKITVALVLGLGIFASIATLIRVKFLADLTDVDDILFAGTDAMVWTLVEPGVAIVASSLVTIRPLLRRMRLKGFESTQRSRSLNFRRRYDRSRAISEIGGHNLDSRQGRVAAAGPGGGGGGGDLRPKDLEASGYSYSYSSRSRSNTNTTLINHPNDNKGFSSLDTTLASRTSHHDRELGNSPVSPQQHWGIGVAITVQEDKDMDDGYGGGGGDNMVTPVSPWAGAGARTDSSESVFFIEGPPEAHQDRNVWRGRTPTDTEQPEVIQGLRYPLRRDDQRQLSFS